MKISFYLTSLKVFEIFEYLKCHEIFCFPPHFNGNLISKNQTIVKIKPQDTKYCWKKETKKDKCRKRLGERNASFQEYIMVFCICK